MNILDIYKQLSWKIKYEAGDMPYPPVLFWKNNISWNDIFNAWEKTINYMKKSKKNHNFWLYVHIPFCHTRCFFCTCVTTVENDKSKYDKYLDLIEIESKQFSKIFENVEFNSVYVWWWTPTILTAKQIDRFYNIIKNNFNLSNVKQIMTEGSPYSINEEKIKILAKHWINKMTFWVQSLDSKTLEKNNRFQWFNDVKNAIYLARKYWIKYINLDVMAWLPKQDMDWFKETIDLIQTLNPTTVNVNWFWPTKNTNYIKNGNIYNNENIKLRNEMESYGHFLEDIEYSLEDPKKKNIQLYNSKNYNSSILWLWYWAISHVFWNLHYSKQSFSNYTKFINWEKILLQWIKLSFEDEIVTYLINNLKNKVYFDNFYNLFWKELNNTRIYKEKIIKLILKKIIIKWKDKDREYIIFFNSKSHLYSSIYSKYLYDLKYINEFILYFLSNKNEFLNLDLRIKQFFVD